jgi:hypothetical protein
MDTIAIVIGSVCFVAWLTIWCFIIVECKNAPMLDEDEYSIDKKD